MKAHAVIVAPVALDDFADIASRLFSSVADEIAAETLADVEDAVASLATSPARGRRVAELLHHPVHAYREILRRRYRIVYRVADGEVLVVAILDHRRDLEGLLHQRSRRDAAR